VPSYQSPYMWGMDSAYLQTPYERAFLQSSL